MSRAETSPDAPLSPNPFDLSDAPAYSAWREHKRSACTAEVAALMVNIEDPCALSEAEHNALTECCRQHNMALYQLNHAEYKDKQLVHRLGEQLGMTHLDTNLRADEDSITSLQVRDQTGNQYIPYTNKPLSWHSDGYYNPLDQQIHGIIMHCVQPAAQGGSNALIDHEQLYIRLRDDNPDYILALMQPDAMTIPANIENEQEIRAAQSGPVFSVEPHTANLHMRYSARQRNIEWANDAITQGAAARITQLLADDSLVLRHQLSAGQGIVCNNVLHNRTGFADSAQQQRLMYRARFYDRVHNSAINRQE